MGYTLTEKDYAKLLREATALAKDKPHVQPEDAVNDTVLEALEAGKPIFLHELLKRLKFHFAKYSVGTEEINHAINGNRISRSNQVQICSCCKQPVPIGGFYVVTRNVGGKGAAKDVYNVVKETLKVCIECQRKKSLAQAKRNAGNPEKSASRKKAQRKYAAKVRKNRTLAQKREYNEKMKAYRETPQWKEYIRKRKEAVNQNWL